MDDQEYQIKKRIQDILSEMVYADAMAKEKYTKIPDKQRYQYNLQTNWDATINKIYNLITTWMEKTKEQCTSKPPQLT